MAKKDRVKNAVIIIIVFGFLVSSIAGTFMLAFQNNNQPTAEEKQAEQFEEYQQQQNERQAQLEPLDGYTATAFDASEVNELKVEVLKEGSGKAATADSTVSANYFGWTSDGKIFDSSSKSGTATPIEFALNGVIEGWTKGLTGVKEGSTVKLTIPAEQAYGAEAPAGYPSGPLAFIVELKEVK